MLESDASDVKIRSRTRADLVTHYTFAEARVAVAQGDHSACTTKG